MNLEKITQNELESPPIALQPPGAGLPFIQHFILKNFIFPFRTRFTNWDEVDTRIAAELQKIRTLLENLDESQLRKRILVSPIPGLEDSSRFWSVCETLDHLSVVGEGQIKILLDLNQGKRPDLTIDIAAVKPKSKESSEFILNRFKSRMDYIVMILRETKWNTQSLAKQNHPWFGEIGIKQWHWLIAAHLWIHRQQLTQIVQGLKKNKK